MRTNSWLPCAITWRTGARRSGRAVVSSQSAAVSSFAFEFQKRAAQAVPLFSFRVPLRPPRLRRFCPSTCVQALDNSVDDLAQSLLELVRADHLFVGDGVGE